MSEIDPITRQWIRCKADQIAAEKGYFFHPPSAEKVIQFARKICGIHHVPWQEDATRRLFGWRRPNGKRRFTRGYVSTAKKNGKTYFVAPIVAYVMIVERGDVASAANSRKQASMVFADLEKIITASKSLSREMQVIPSTKHILVPRTLATYQAMSADVETGDGVRAKLAIYDEYHRAKDSALYDILQPAGEGQDEPLFLVVTTSGESINTPCGDLYQYAKKVEAGNISDESELGFFTDIHEAGEKDDPASEETWKKANPSLGYTMDLSAFRGFYLEASQSPTRLATFRRLRLNQWVSAETEGAWLNQDEWAAAYDKSITLAMLRTLPCWAGLDLSSTRDVTAFVLLFKLEDGRYFILPYFWLPGAKMANREKRDGVPYYAWSKVAANNLTITEGNVQDYAAIRSKINELREVFDIRDCAFDRWNAQQICNDLVSDGLTMTPFGQGFGSMNGPSKEFERLLGTGGLAHGNNPLLNHMASKCIVETDAAGSIKPSKKKSTHRIDGVVGGVMALGRAMMAEPDFAAELSA